MALSDKLQEIFFGLRHKEKKAPRWERWHGFQLVVNIMKISYFIR